ncbi:hypothetical protein [Actinoplanes solisilvae]|uniref:hypothetical protein n=1 Tax=Actinoplanes solisilvae TaxID=2486853 RepID=UPI000FD9E870|nr:hypothetical protein [Actinoplanes solisilvae]
MTETGWPLIPREVLPAPVEAAKRPVLPRPVPPHDAGRQLPFFGAETTEPSPADLAGLLAGPGRLGRMGGTARVSVLVSGAWRVHVLVAELVARGLVAHWRPADPEGVRGDDRDETPELSAPEDERPGTPEPRFEVLTAYSRRLNGLAEAWPRAAAQLFLSGPRLRLWVAAAGDPVPGGYALGLDPAKDVTEIDGALVRAGLAGRLSDDGRRYSIMGRRRVTRLAELVGERPLAAPAQLWPGGASA